MSSNKTDNKNSKAKKATANKDKAPEKKTAKKPKSAAAATNGKKNKPSEKTANGKNGSISPSGWKPADYKSGVRPVWCPGCGHYGALSAFQRGLAMNNIDPKDLVIVSGIGCSGRFSHFVKGYGFHVLHGRVLPVCQGIAASTDQSKGLLVCGISGDGDALAIGGGHVPHAARRNPNMVYIVLDNGVYGLTKGQFSPTTSQQVVTATSPYGVTEDNLDPLSLFLGYNTSFVARGFSANNKQLADIMAQAIRHRGFSVVHVLTPCVTFNKFRTYDYLSSVVKELPKDYDPKDKVQAFNYAQDPESVFTGVFFKEERPTMHDHHERAFEMSKREPDEELLESLVERFT